GDWLIHINYGIGQVIGIEEKNCLMKINSFTAFGHKKTMVFFGYRLRRRQKMIVSAPSFSKIAWYLNGLPVWKSLHSPAVSS
ncbi:MAG TPA: hypothetical protein VI451_11960, partial [Anaerolineales bacterium]|nr:hypothetical protein [Anaerolineales bacterium]